MPTILIKISFRSLAEDDFATMTKLISTLLLVVGLLPSISDAFVVSRTDGLRSTRTTMNREAHHRATTTTTTTTVLCAAGSATTNERKGGETLRFAGDLTFDSVPVERNSGDDLSAFLKRGECRRLLLGAGGTRDVESLPASSELQGMWTKQINSGFVANDLVLPETPDEFLRTDTVVRFPGLTLTNTVVNGFSIVDGGNTTNEGPRCVSLLIGESRTTSGRKPLVWLFNRLTGDGGQQEYSEPKASVVTQTSVVDGRGDDTAYAFRIDVRFQVLIGFPKRLLRILPAKKETMESQGSAAIRRAMSKDFEQAVEGVRAGFLKSQRSLSPPATNEAENNIEYNI